MPSGWALPCWCQLLRATRRALRRHRSRAGALPRGGGDFDHDSAHAAGEQAAGHERHHEREDEVDLVRVRVRVEVGVRVRVSVRVRVRVRVRVSG